MFFLDPLLYGQSATVTFLYALLIVGPFIYTGALLETDPGASFPDFMEEVLFGYTDFLMGILG